MLGYLLLSVVVTWPLALNFTSRLPGNRPLDIWLHVWNLWWVRQALTVLHTNPFETRWIFYPDGVPLYLHTLVPLVGALMAPVGWLWGEIVAYNVSVLCGLTLAGMSAYWLARRWASPWGAALAGVAFAVAPWVLHQLRVGHLNLMHCGFLPLGIWLLLRASDSGRPRDMLLAVAGLFAAALVDWQFVVFLGVAGLILLIERAVTAPSRQEARRRILVMSTVAVAFGALLLPFAVAVGRQTATVAPDAMARYQAAQQEYSADLAGYVMPQLLHPIWGRAVSAWIVDHPLGAPTEGRVGLAITTLLLAGAAIVARRPGVWLWLAIGLVGMLLSLGPAPTVLGQELGLPGPFSLLDQVPFISLSRTPARFAVLTALAGAILCGIGLDTVRAAVARRRGHAAARAVAACLSLLLCFELWPAPYPSVAPLSSELPRRVADLAGDGAVLELPYLADDSPRLFYQTIHQRPITSGYISRQPPKTFLLQTPVIADLMWPRDEADILETDGLGTLATFGIRAIVVYRPPYYRPDDDRPGVSEATMRRRVQALLKLDGPTWEDATGAIYAVPVAAPRPVVTLADGWHAPEQTPDGPMRWLATEGAIRLDHGVHQPLTLTFTAHSFDHPRSIVVEVAGRTLTTLAVGAEPTVFQVPLSAAIGATRVNLRSLDGAVSPAELGRGADPRRLSIAVSNLRIR